MTDHSNDENRDDNSSREGDTDSTERNRNDLQATDRGPNNGHTGEHRDGIETGETEDDPVQDPVKEAFGGREDLYEIATWEVRSFFDAAIVRLLGALVDQRRRFFITLAFSLFLGQITLVSLILLEAPFLGILSVLSVVPAVLLVVKIWSSDPTKSEPLSLIAVTFVLAILFASFAAILNSLFLPAFEMIPVLGLPLFFFLVVGPVEEFVKLLAVRAHAFESRQFQTVVDGVVYGAVAGLGFAAIENLIYIVFFSVTTTPFESIIEQQYAVGIAVTRSFVGPGHVIFSAWAGFYLGLAKFNPEHRLPIICKGLLIAAAIHALYNTVVSLVPLPPLWFGLFIVVYYLFWLGLLYRKVRRYRTLYDLTRRVAHSEAR